MNVFLTLVKMVGHVLNKHPSQDFIVFVSQAFQVLSVRQVNIYFHNLLFLYYDLELYFITCSTYSLFSFVYHEACTL